MENWRIFRRLIGHDNDVQELGWSYDGSILVSVGLDSKVVIWSGHTFEKLKTLPNHQSHVKGLTFDPANKYFATASDDRTMKFFSFTSPGPNSTAHDQMNNFTLEHTVSAPFVNSPLTTYFRRCSWGPDGLNIAAPNAVNGPTCSIVIISRGSWKTENHLIGHEAPVEVCAFSPRLYEGTGGLDRKHVTVIASGGLDKSLSCWTSASPRPLFVSQDMTTKSISDLAWSPDGMSLFITSLDGTITALVFEDKEIGRPQPMQENERALEKYTQGRKGAGLIETPDAMILEELSKAGELKGAEGRMGDLMGDNQTQSPAKVRKSAEINRSSETIQSTEGEAATSLTNGVNGTAKGKPIDRSQARLQTLKQRVEITKDGKKRIKPLLVSGAGGIGESSLPQTRLLTSAAANPGSGADAPPQSIVDLSKPFDGLPKGGLAALLLGNKRKYAQIEGDEDGQVEKRIALAGRNGAVPILANGVDGLLPAQPQPAANGAQTTPEFIRPAVVNPVLAVSQLRLAVPKVRNVIIQALDSSGNPTATPSKANSAKPSSDLVFEVKNPSSQSITGRAQDREPARVSLSKGDQPVWSDFLPRTALLATGNKDFWAVADETGGITTWSAAGRRLLNTLVLDAQPVILESDGWFLLCITAVGMCHVWNLQTLSSPHPPVSLAPVLDAAVHSLSSHPTGHIAITHARLNSEGRIVVCLTNGDGYAYSPQLYTWQRLSEAWWAVGSQYWNTTDMSVVALKRPNKNQKTSEESRAVSAGIIPFLERCTTNVTLLAGRAYFLQRLFKALISREGFEGFESGVAIAHLENRVNTALMLGAKDEFKIYLLMYVKRLGAEGLRGKAEELLRTILGGIMQDEDGKEKVMEDDGNGRTWQGNKEMICGWERTALLKDIVVQLGKCMIVWRV